MNIFLTTDGYHLTMGYLMDGEHNEAMEMETQILYARTGGPLVVPNLTEMVRNYLSHRPTMRDVEEADEYWTSQGVPFNRKAAEQIVRSKSFPITVRGVADGQVVLPGEPIAVIKAPAFMSAIPEPVYIGEMMTDAQIATRFTKIAQALSWEYHRVFEVGMRADKVQSHTEKVGVLADVGLMMTSSGIAGKTNGIRAGGSMGHRYMQRFPTDYAGFMHAVDRMLEFKREKGIEGKVKLSFLLDTRNTLKKGLPDALRVIEERYQEIVENIDLSVRIDSGDLEAQLIMIIRAFKKRFNFEEFVPAIIVESGLTAVDIDFFEDIARAEGFPLSKMLYGVGGYLIGGISRDQVSMVYKVSSYGGTPTMKFGDEADRGKESYPGDITLVQRPTGDGVERMIALREEMSELTSEGWEDVFVAICEDGVMRREKEYAQVLIDMERKELIATIQGNWELVAKGYIGEDKRPDEFDARPKYSEGVQGMVERIRSEQLEAA